MKYLLILLLLPIISFANEICGYKKGGSSYECWESIDLEWEQEKKLMIEKKEKEEAYDEANKKEIEMIRSRKLIKDTPYSKLNDVYKKEKLQLLKQDCKELGFKADSKEYKNCIVELMN